MIKAAEAGMASNPGRGLWRQYYVQPTLIGNASGMADPISQDHSIIEDSMPSHVQIPQILDS